MNEWSYKFTRPDESELETQDFTGDGAAEDRARDLSRAHDTPVVLHRHSAHVDAWEFVAEVDDRH